MKGLSDRALAAALAVDESISADEEMSTKNIAAAPPGSWVRVYDKEGNAIRTWKSAIVGGDELKAGGTYILQRTTDKAPEYFTIGKAYRALRDSEGSFSGEVVDDALRTFIVDERDLFTT